MQVVGLKHGYDRGGRKCSHGYTAKQRPANVPSGWASSSGTWVRDVCPEDCKLGGWESAAYQVQSEKSVGFGVGVGA